MKLSDDGVLGSVGHMGWSVMCGRCSLCPSVGSGGFSSRMYNAVSVVVFHFRASGIDLAGNRDVH